MHVHPKEAHITCKTRTFTQKRHIFISARPVCGDVVCGDVVCGDVVCGQHTTLVFISHIHLITTRVHLKETHIT